MKRKPVILIALLLAAFVINLDTTIVNVALPTLVRQLHTSSSQLQWVVDAFNLLFAGSVLVFGSLSDRFGRKGMLLAGLSVFGLASLVGGLTDSAGALIAARAVMGVGAAMVFPSTLSLLTNVFTERADRALAIGLWGGDHRRGDRARADRRRLAAAGVRLAQHLLRDDPDRGASQASWSSATSRPRVTRTRPASTAAASPCQPRRSRCSSTRSSRRRTTGWGSARTLGSFVLTAVLAGAFVGWERRRDEPMLDLSLFGNPRFTAASASVAISFFALSGFIFLVTQYFQFLKGYGPLSTGVRLLPVASCVAISSILGARLAVRVGTKLVVASGLFLMAAFYVWVTTTSARTGYGTIAAQMVVLGTGMGATSAPATEAIMGVVPRAKAGVGSAVNDATRLLGGTLGVAVIGSVYASLYASRLAGRSRPDCRPPSRDRRTHPWEPRSSRRASSGRPAIRRSLRLSTRPPAQRSSTDSTPPTTSLPALPPRAR